jgi:hypothetical protein
MYPLTWQYLNDHHDRLASRNKGNIGTGWYGYVYRKNHLKFNTLKLVTPSNAEKATFAMDATGTYYFVGSGTGGGGGYGITLKDREDVASLSYYYLLGVLNSKVCSFYLKKESTVFRGGYIGIERRTLSQIPIRLIDFKDPDDVMIHDTIVDLVQKLVKVRTRLEITHDIVERATLNDTASQIGTRIDNLVYELYGLKRGQVQILEKIVN